MDNLGNISFKDVAIGICAYKKAKQQHLSRSYPNASMSMISCYTSHNVYLVGTQEPH